MKNNNSEENSMFDAEFSCINILADRGQIQKALERCNELFLLFPDNPRVIHALGLLNYRAGNLEDWEELIRRAIQLKPDYLDAHFNLGRILHLSMRNDEAEAVFRAGILLSPNDPKQLLSLASILAHKRQYREAFKICHRVLEINPSLPDVHGKIGDIMLALGETKKAFSSQQKELKQSSSHTAHSCILFLLNLISGFTQHDIYIESLAWAKQHLSWLDKRFFRGHFNVPDPDRKLRIGFVSGDFRKHPVGFHIHLLLESYNKSNMTIYLYDACPLKESMTQELANLADYYRSIALMPDDKAEQVIRRDGIDILVDLSGHTGMHRLMLFARSPAPVQATWIGYFNTTGLSAMDYFIGDPITTPPEDDYLFSETVIRLPDNRFCYKAPSYAPDVSLTPSLKNGHITFGSFNGIHKISDEVVALWCRVLKAVAGSRFILKLVFVDGLLIERIYSLFESYGVLRESLEIRGSSLHDEMLAEYGDIDISLDTFPFNGGITTCESLWMGVPVVTLAGNTPIARQSKAYLHTIGHPEWVATFPDEYVAIAKALALDPVQLNTIRMTLRNQMADSPLCNGRLFADNLELTFREIWKRWCNNRSLHLDVSPVTTRRFTADELFDAGVNCLNDGDYGRAELLFRRFIRRRPGHAPAYNNLAVVMKKMKLFDEAVHCFRQAIKNDPENVDLYTNLGLTFQDLGCFKQARDIFRQACQLAPDNCNVWNNLGTAYRFMGKLKEARQAYQKALEIDPQHVESLGLLAVIWGMYGDNSRSLELLKTALSIEPDNQFVLAVLIGCLMYEAGTRQEELYALAKRFESCITAPADSTSQPGCMPLRSHLRVGFISPDFRGHPVGMLLSSFFGNYDRSRLSLVCFYSSARAPDHLTDWYRSVATAWHDVANMESEALVKKITNEQLDILVDLSGHTNTNTNGISAFRHKSAPVQVTWLGYGHTTGLSSIDFVIADRDFIRPEDCAWFTEKPVYLSHNRFCFTPPDHSPEVVESPYADNGYITFGSFNNLVKINDQVISLWASILRQVPKSRLVLKYKSLNEYDVRKFTLERFKKHGLAANRIELRPSSNLYFMLIEYGDLDITLDPFPFTGGMTSLFSLWMGVPIITLPSEMPVSRQTKSFLDLVELDMLVARTQQEYVEKAVKLALEPEKLASIRRNLRERMLASPLCDAESYSRELENLFFSMYEQKRISLKTSVDMHL